ncbi:alpha/beta fold hydrolase [Paenibacillus baekrokdamisoli]|uniref:alpha/beta fold hydrolase n=1 Tax=Paenibacillus baekrokdamisoli TaxID=1712516 RepID=UPI001E40C896|nr:alpha/beta hydrolase [Paenibacillus baekrokdamisoli]
MQRTGLTDSVSIWRRLVSRKAFRIIVALLLFLVVFLYILLPFVLDRLDGTAKPLGILPNSVSLKGQEVLPTRFLQRPDGKIAFDDSGTPGPLVICVPSMGDLRQEYRYLTPQLAAAGYRVVTMDVRGHGESSVGWSDYSAAAVGSDILALAAELNAGSAYIIGTSMAGGAAVWAAAEAPNLIAGQVLIDAFVRDHPSTFMDKLIIKLGSGGPWGQSVWSMYYKTLYPTKPPVDISTYIGALKANLRESGRFTALKKMLAGSQAATEARINSVKAPTLIIMGTKDPDFPKPEEEVAWLKEHLHGDLLMVEGAGHYPHAEMPEQVGPAIIAFLKGHH